ncbi:MAG TPA: protein-L-isoaspartate(D-aspartate) O-methyltransferase [Pelomicrobium sp.]|nr:protein-L-isoaspartate(D-aspartate) O-methyltransferase [Pelomicrobium sp.]
MVSTIESHTRATATYTGHAALSPRVMAAMAKVPRHRFVPPEWAGAAYADRPLPIGHGQTISQPFVVALMTDLLDLKGGERVLEIGTGSGYQAAVLAELAKKVYTIEIVDPLGQRAAALLRELGYANVEVRIGDGYRGWPEAAPFDAIIVTAAPPSVPEALVRQLKPGGRLVLPVGATHEMQVLTVIEKRADGSLERKPVLPVRFVPMVQGRLPFSDPAAGRPPLPAPA